jgi:ketosteroid isomerase-like protein
VTSWLEVLEDFRADLDEVIDAGDQTISVAVVRGRGSASGVEVAEPYVFLRTWRDGKTVEVREYRTKQEALNAAELQER